MVGYQRVEKMWHQSWDNIDIVRKEADEPIIGYFCIFNGGYHFWFIILMVIDIVGEKADKPIIVFFCILMVDTIFDLF